MLPAPRAFLCTTNARPLHSQHLACPMVLFQCLSSSWFLILLTHWSAFLLFLSFGAPFLGYALFAAPPLRPYPSSLFPSSFLPPSLPSFLAPSFIRPYRSENPKHRNPVPPKPHTLNPKHLQSPDTLNGLKSSKGHRSDPIKHALSRENQYGFEVSAAPTPETLNP